MPDEMVIFTRTYDLLTWLLPRAEKFPKSQRFAVTARLQGAALDFQEALYEANAHEGTGRLDRLRDADACLNNTCDWRSSGSGSVPGSTST